MDSRRRGLVRLVRSYSVIGMETLSIKGMMKGFKKLRRSVANAWGIGTGTTEGKLMLRAREIVREAEAAAANA